MKLRPRCELNAENWNCLPWQVPDATSDSDEKIEAVVLDDDAVGVPDKQGIGAKILRGEGALELFLGNLKRPSKVRNVAGLNGQHASMIVSPKLPCNSLGVCQPLICRDS